MLLVLRPLCLYFETSLRLSSTRNNLSIEFSTHYAHTFLYLHCCQKVCKQLWFQVILPSRLLSKTLVLAYGHIKVWAHLRSAWKLNWSRITMLRQLSVNDRGACIIEDWIMYLPLSYRPLLLLAESTNLFIRSSSPTHNSDWCMRRWATTDLERQRTSEGERL